MSNSYFQFKQFIVGQEECTMKVCTDACILGAWFSEKIPSPSLVLDLGSGTGLLMLMLAQKNESEIHGIESDLPSFKQSQKNISISPWKDRMRVFPGDARGFSFHAKYDFIISNPPFFENDLMSASERINTAKHGTMLNLNELIRAFDANLQEQGSFGILLSQHRTAYFEELAASNGFHLSEKLMVRQTLSHEPFRSILQFSRKRPHFIPFSELAIQNQEGEYSADFIELMKDYYLNL